MIPTCKLCGAQLPIVDGRVQSCPNEHNLGLDPSHPDVRRVRPDHDLGAERDARPMLCRERTWCTLPLGHGGACVEVPRAPIAASEYGPRRRWERR